MERQPVLLFRWDVERQVLVYDGSHDPDPDWRWIPEKQGYEPIDQPHKIWDRRLGAWVFVPKEVH